jgi:hypothetical protein
LNWENANIDKWCENRKKETNEETIKTIEELFKK